MNKSKQFIAQQGSNSTVRIFEANSGKLYRVITVGGNIVSQPYIAGHIMTVTVESAGKTACNKFLVIPKKSSIT